MLSCTDYRVPLRKNKRTAVERIEKFISDGLFNAKNLHGRIYGSSIPLKNLSHWHFPFEKTALDSWKKWPVETVRKQPFALTAVGASFGPTWATHWFKFEVDVPPEWRSTPNTQVHLRWNSNSEALLYSKDGRVLQGLSFMNTGRNFHPLTEEEMHSLFYLEMSCNDDFGAGKSNAIAPPDESRTFRLELADVAIFRADLYKLRMDLEILGDIGSKGDENNPRSWEALYVANEMINLIQVGSEGAASSLAESYFSQHNGDGTHLIVALGNCHIDSAWLWPVDETIRKCARSWSSTLALMETNLDYTFVASQAQQFEWVKHYYPELFERIRLRVKEGRFIPVGGTWIEMDGNIPSGESFIRQFLYGQTFFQQEFGITCEEFWLPDTFGYSPQIPQMIKHMGMRYFLTQKLSWSLVNKFPHNSFLWEGIDGSSVLSHFPPSDSYVDQIKVEDVIRLQKNLKDKGRVDQSVMLYGFGDGGGGPTQDMLERAARIKDTNGLPRLKLGTPSQFWSNLQNRSKHLSRWVGELYLELHNGTYTTQAALKNLNRRCELSLREAEVVLSILLSQTSTSDSFIEKQKHQLASSWKTLLLNQFHDILPGSSIERVNVRAREDLKSTLKTSERIAGDAIEKFLQTLAENEADACAPLPSKMYINTLPWDRSTILLSGSDAVRLRIPAYGFAVEGGASVVEEEAISAFQVRVIPNENILLQNQHLQVTVDKWGRVISLIHRPSRRECVPSTKTLVANEFCLYDDIPLYWDAWDMMDYHLETRLLLNGEKGRGTIDAPSKVIEDGPLKKVVGWEMRLGDRSSLVQKIILGLDSEVLEFETTVNWVESHKCLKVEFQFDVLSREVTYETQFGHLCRPNHSNTSWDAAKFEVVGHKWADISETGFGVAILNDCKYGWNATGNKMSLSILRAPKNPDGNADMGEHVFRYGIFPHQGSFQSAGLVQKGYEFNLSLRHLQPSVCFPGIRFLGKSFFRSSNPAVVLETVKPAEDGTRSVVLRLYEAHGGSQSTQLCFGIPISGVWECNGMEDQRKPLASPEMELTFGPFQLRSFYVTLH